MGHLHERFPFRLPHFLALIMVISLVLLFCIYPQSGDLILMVTSWNRVLFSLICFAICAIVYWASPVFPPKAHLVFSFLGEVSYSIYLLNPLVFGAVRLLNERIGRQPDYYVFIVSIPLTLIVSFACYRIVELPMMKFGKFFSEKLVKI